MKGLRFSKSLLQGSRLVVGSSPSPPLVSASGLLTACPTGQPSRSAAAPPGRVRCFSHTSPHTKKAAPKNQPKNSKAGSPAATTTAAAAAARPEPAAPDGRPRPNPEEPFDLADLEHGWALGAEHFETELRRLRAGGRFNPDAIGAVRVRPDRRAAETFPLHEVAAIAPRGGRSIAVLVHEAALVKPVMSAIQASPEFNQQPQRSPDNELELLLRVEPERKDALARRARDLCHAWREQIRAERHKRDALAKKWRKDNVLTANDKTRLDKELQKMQDKKMAVVDAREKEVLHNIAAREGL